MYFLLLCRALELCRCGDEERDREWVFAQSRAEFTYRAMGPLVPVTAASISWNRLQFSCPPLPPQEPGACAQVTGWQD